MGGGVHEKPIQRGHCLKEGPWPVFWFKGGLGKKEGGGGFEGDWYPNAHYEITWINWELNLVYLWNLASLCHIPKEINWSKKSTKTAVWKLVSGF